MITPGIAASLTPKSVERTQRTEATPRARRRLRVPQVLLHVPHPHLHLPQRPRLTVPVVAAPVELDAGAAQLKTTVRSPLSSTRDSQCQRTARASTRDSTSSPARTRSSGVIRWSTRTTSCSMIGPSSRSAVT